MKKILIAGIAGVFVISALAMGQGMRQGGFDRGNKRPDQGQIFKMLDKDGDGVLSQDEFSQAQEKFGKVREKMMEKNGNMGDFRKQIMERFDSDKDGKLSDQEKVNMKEFMKNKAEERKQYMLERFDTDKDGRLSREELEKSREQIREDMEKNREFIMNKYDKDKNGVLSPDEREEISLDDIDKMPAPFMGKPVNGRMKPMDRMKQGRAGKKQGQENNNNRVKGDRNRIGYNNEIIMKYHLMRFDENNDGILDSQERMNAQQEDRKYFDRFDADSDGRLNEEERNNFEKFMEKIAEEYISTRERL